MKIRVVIPARYASKRLPGKPLLLIAGKTMLQRVVSLSRAAIAGLAHDALVVVATDDERIKQHAKDMDVPVIMTSIEARTGTDRVAEAVAFMADEPDFVINMQGDAPFTPPEVIRAMIDAFVAMQSDVVTPVTQLSWSQLDKFRQQKLTTPFSGTTALFDEVSGRAFWFSKTILPALRHERELRGLSDKSPVFRHIGLYGYSLAALNRFVQLPESQFEALEGLEQLRLLEHGLSIRCVPLPYGAQMMMSGVDSPEDLLRANRMIEQHGDDFLQGVPL